MQKKTIQDLDCSGYLRFTPPPAYVEAGTSISFNYSLELQFKNDTGQPVSAEVEFSIRRMGESKALKIESSSLDIQKDVSNAQVNFLYLYTALEGSNTLVLRVTINKVKEPKGLIFEDAKVSRFHGEK